MRWLLVLALVLIGCSPASVSPGSGDHRVPGDDAGGGDGTVGDTTPGDLAPGDSSGGDTTPGDPAAGDPSSGDTSGDPLWGTPHIHDPSHLGWKNQHCDVCHQLPRPNHTAANPWECAACHGGNGACNPNGVNVPRTHDPEVDVCTTCHSSNHGFEQAAQCVSCHFAQAAVVDCRTGPGDDGGPAGDPVPGDASGGDGGLSLATLEDNCFNFPTESFGPTNNCGGVSINVSAGQRAYEFTLRDVSGTTHTLSTLLATRPVLLVFGSFT